MTVLHSTEPATVYLSLVARVEGLTVADVDRALYEDRTLVKQLAMRRTLFMFPRDLLPAAWGSACARVAASQDAAGWPRSVEQRRLADGRRRWLDRRLPARCSTCCADGPRADHERDPRGAAGAAGNVIYRRGPSGAVTSRSLPGC